MRRAAIRPLRVVFILITLSITGMPGSCASGSPGSPTLERADTASGDWWSGHWWPYRDNRNPNLYDAGEAMEVYWTYIRATRSPASLAGQPDAVSVERDHRCPVAGCPPDNSDYCGHCHAWAAASVREREPTRIVTKRIVRQVDAAGRIVLLPAGSNPPDPETFVLELFPGAVRVDTQRIVFRIGHQKGLLTELWFWRLQDPVGEAHGHPDITPGQFHETLVGWIKGGLVLDEEPGDPIWNYPLHRYRTRWTEQSAADTIIRRYTTTLTKIRTTSPDAIGMHTAQLEYRYTLKYRSGAIVSDGTWDSSARPGYLWRPSSGPMSGNSQVTVPCVREVIDRGDETIYIRTTADYRPWPC
jgi:hypothetical protein